MGVQSPSTLASVSTGPLNPLQTSYRSCKGNRITPSNLSESICCLFKLKLILLSASLFRLFLNR